MAKTQEEKRACGRQYYKETYALLKSRGICIKCKQKDAVPGMIYCQECREKNNLRRCKDTYKYKPRQAGGQTKEEYNEYHREWMRAFRAKREYALTLRAWELDNNIQITTRKENRYGPEANIATVR